MQTVYRAYRFAGGHFAKTNPPEWFTKAINSGLDWPNALRRAGAMDIEEFENGAESLHIFEGPKGDYFIGYWDTFKCVIQVFIDDPADYFHFRVTYIAPLAILIRNPAQER